MKSVITLIVCTTLLGCGGEKVVTERSSSGELITKTVQSGSHVDSQYRCYDGVLYITSGHQLAPSIRLDENNNIKGVPCKQESGESSTWE
jgi:hypothetical protein